MKCGWSDPRSPALNHFLWCQVLGLLPECGWSVVGFTRTHPHLIISMHQVLRLLSECGWSAVGQLALTRTLARALISNVSGLGQSAGPVRLGTALVAQFSPFMHFKPSFRSKVEHLDFDAENRQMPAIKHIEPISDTKIYENNAESIQT